MKRTVASFLFFAVLLILQGCYENEKKVNRPSDKMQMMRTDEAFSAMSRRDGMKKAFLEFIDNEGILLRPNHLPIVGADAIDFLSQADDTTYTLTWKPSGGEISSSGDLGFTYGVYLLALPDTALSGTYVSIWKKQADGKWKFILDSGNQGTR